MSLDPNWPRWIKASIYKHFKNLATLPVFLEAEPNRKTNQDVSFLEVRMDGPYLHEVVSDSFDVRIEVNILIQTQQSILTAQGFDTYTPDRIAGDVALMFTKSISIFKLGAGTGDDQTLLDCLTLDTSDRSRGIIIHQFGLLQPALPVVQDSVEGRYFTRLKGI